MSVSFRCDDVIDINIHSVPAPLFFTLPGKVYRRNGTIWKVFRVGRIRIVFYLGGKNEKSS